MLRTASASISYSSLLVLFGLSVDFHEVVYWVIDGVLVRYREQSSGQVHGTGLELATLFLMPRYFFHTYHDRPHVDHEGEELPDKHAAWREATVMAGQTLQGLDGNLQPGREWRMEVTDEVASRLFVLHIHAERPK